MSNGKNDDILFETLLKGIKFRMSKNIIITLCCAMIIDDKQKCQ